MKRYFWQYVVLVVRQQWRAATFSAGHTAHNEYARSQNFRARYGTIAWWRDREYLTQSPTYNLSWSEIWRCAGTCWGGVIVPAEKDHLRETFVQMCDKHPINSILSFVQDIKQHFHYVMIIVFQHQSIGQLDK